MAHGKEHPNSDHSDMVITSPADGEALVYDNATSKWKNKKSLSRPRCRIYQGSAQTLTTGVWAQITLNTATYDTHSMIGTNKITIPTGQGGLYLLIGSVGFTANANGLRDVRIAVEGVTRAEARGGPNGTDHTIRNVQDVREVLEGDDITLWGIQASGGNLSTRNLDYGTFLIAVRLD